MRESTSLILVYFPELREEKGIEEEKEEEEKEKEEEEEEEEEKGS